MTKEFIISDTHFYHSNIINYCNRPFKDTIEMNNNLINNWNSVVSKDDIVFHAGDFSFCSREHTKSIIDKLNGNIILIRGNHDKYSRTKFLECGIKEVYKEYNYKNSYTDKNIIITHSPLKDVPFDYINIHGHIHNTIYEEYNKPWYINVSAEVINYTPVLLEDLLKNK